MRGLRWTIVVAATTLAAAASGQAPQRNSRLGATFSFPVARANSLKLVWTSGLTTRIGADFDSVNVLYQYTWTGKGP